LAGDIGRDRVMSWLGPEPALDHAVAAGAPYLVNILTDPEVANPRAITGV
jgi:hypothetical protein